MNLENTNNNMTRLSSNLGLRVCANQDPKIQNHDVPTSGLVVKLRGSEVRHLHYLASFRVLRGAAEIFGAVFVPSPKYVTVVAPSWSGSLTIRAAHLTSIKNRGNNNNVEENNNHEHEESGYQCGNSHNSLEEVCGSCHCDVTEWSSHCQGHHSCGRCSDCNCHNCSCNCKCYNDEAEAIIEFKGSVDTAFGNVRSSDMVGLHCAFDSAMVDDVPAW